MSQPAQRRALVQQLQEQQQLSQRRVCQALGFDRSSMRYASNAAKQERDQALTQRLQQLAQEHPRFGYRRINAMLQRQNHSTQSANHKRVQRLWRSVGLSLPRRRPKKRRVSRSQVARQRATRPNQIWCYDFVYDVCSNGAKLKMLTIEDEFTRESLAVEVGGSLPTVRVIAVLERLFEERSAPEGLRSDPPSDNGPEFVAGAIQNWLTKNAVQTHYIEPGRPWQNGIAESFNGKLRDECLSREWFQNRVEAAALVARYQRYYNEERPHSSLDYQTPLECRLAYEASEAMKLATKNDNS